MRIYRPEADPESPSCKFTNGEKEAWVTYSCGDRYLVNIEGVVTIDIDCSWDQAQMLGEPTCWEGSLRQVVDALGL